MAVLYLESLQFNDLTETHQEYLSHIASRLAVTLEQIERAQTVRRLLDIAMLLTQEKEFQNALKSVVEQTMTAMRAVSAVTIYYVDQASGELLLGKWDGIRKEAALAKRPPYTRSIIAGMWERDTPVFAEKVVLEPLLNGPFTQREEIKSTAAFPLKIKEVRVGCMFFNYRMPHVFDEGERSLLKLFAQLTAVAIHQAHLEEVAKEEVQLRQERETRERAAKMATGLIHDVKTSLANIPRLTGEITEMLEQGEDVNTPLHELKNAAVSTSRVSDRLKNFVITGQFEPRIASLEAIIKKAMIAGKEFEPSNVSTSFTGSGFAPQINADEVWIELLLKNLLMNAYDSICEGSKGLVSINVKIDSDNILIQVKDNGKGIQSDLLPTKIFEYGVTTKEESHMTGIGLYFCHKIAETHGGSLTVTSEIDVGSTFTVRLPITDPEPPPFKERV